MSDKYIIQERGLHFVTFTVVGWIDVFTTLYSNKLIEQKTNYIHHKPVVAGSVEQPHHYIYSSANRFTELKLSEM